MYVDVIDLNHTKVVPTGPRAYFVAAGKLSTIQLTKYSWAIERSARPVLLVEWLVVEKHVVMLV